MAAGADRQRRFALIAGVVAIVLVVGRWAVPLPTAPASEAPVERYSPDRLESLEPYLSASTLAMPEQRLEVARPLDVDPFASDAPAPAVEPMASHAFSAVAGVDPQLSAILIADDRRIAIIDDRVASVGDTLAGGARIREIAAGHVVLLGRDGRQRTIPLK